MNDLILENFILIAAVPLIGALVLGFALRIKDWLMK